MTCGFKALPTVFLSYCADGNVLMKGSVPLVCLYVEINSASSKTRIPDHYFSRPALYPLSCEGF